MSRNRSYTGNIFHAFSPDSRLISGERVYKFDNVCNFFNHNVVFAFAYILIPFLQCIMDTQVVGSVSRKLGASL